MAGGHLGSKNSEFKALIVCLRGSVFRSYRTLKFFVAYVFLSLLLVCFCVGVTFFTWLVLTDRVFGQLAENYVHTAEHQVSFVTLVTEVLKSF